MGEQANWGGKIYVMKLTETSLVYNTVVIAICAFQAYMIAVDVVTYVTVVHAGYNRFHSAFYWVVESRSWEQ